MEIQPAAKKRRVEVAEEAAAEETQDAMADASDNLACRIEWPCVPMQYKYQSGKSMYVRECYDKFYTLIEGRVLAKEPIVTVTGTEGIGKSVFYGYFFDRFRRDHPEICVIAVSFIQKVSREVLIYRGDGSEPERPLGENAAAVVQARTAAATAAIALGRRVVYLYDGPPDAFWRSTCVVFASPSDAFLTVVEKFYETYYMPPWALEELCHATRVLELPMSKSQLTAESDRDTQAVLTVRYERYAEIQARFEIFGGAPRYCLHPDPAKVALAAKKLERAIATIDDLPALKSLLHGKAPEIVRHRLLQYVPEDDNCRSEKTRLVSSHVAKKVAENLLATYQSEREQEDLRWTLCNIPAAASLYQLVFETETPSVLLLRAGTETIDTADYDR